jgi:serine/threonine protein kinase
MRHVPGDRVGPYTIVAKLGEGGMGEVFRAHDTTLGRDVALKVLPEAFAGVADRLARLEREARIMAALNHPNIAAIHGLAESASGPALVLELVEGPTLADRLASGALPLDETLRVGRQIADAIEAAHEQGIVHRDLKPANIKIRPDGTVKVLDFGIAKLLEAADQSPASDQATVSATSRGVLIGTTSYMSPEQARGGEVTRQSDVWAFGAILFEMLAGKRPFTGATTSDVLAAILRGTPDWTALPAARPATIVRLVRRCLEREPKARVHDIGDARLELEDAERALHEHPPAAHTRARSARGIVLMIAGAAFAALAIAAYLRLPRVEPAREEIRLQMPPPPGMRFVSVPAISPDGRLIVFSAAPDAGGPPQLWLRRLAAGQPNYRGPRARSGRSGRRTAALSRSSPTKN